MYHTAIVNAQYKKEKSDKQGQDWKCTTKSLLLADMIIFIYIYIDISKNLHTNYRK